MWECLYKLVFETLGEMLGSYNPLYLLAKCCMYLFFVIIIYYNFFKRRTKGCENLALYHQLFFTSLYFFATLQSIWDTNNDNNYFYYFGHGASRILVL